MGQSILFVTLLLFVANPSIEAQPDTLVATINSFLIMNARRSDTLKLTELTYATVTSAFGPPTSERRLDGNGPTEEVWDGICYGTSCINISNGSELSWIEINSSDLLLLAYGAFEIEVGGTIDSLKQVFPHAFGNAYSTPAETTDRHAMVPMIQVEDGVYEVTDHAVYISFDPATELITAIGVHMN
ncbi:MAG: hypothetical protein R3330_00850 [Saprospiraceae bacterium]|nr:hypothetical protein [Saprospiraceae bacterium]